MAGELEFSGELEVAPEEGAGGGLRAWPYRLLLLILLWLELTFTAGCVTTLLQVTPDVRFLMAGGAVCGLFWLCFFGIRKRWRFALLFVYCAAVVFLFFRNFGLVQDGAREVGNAASQLIYSYYKISIGYWHVTESRALATGVLFAFATQLVGACYALVLFRAKGAFLSALFLAGAALLGLLVGEVPQGVYFIGAVFCALFQFVFGRMDPQYCVRDGKIFQRNEGDAKKRAQTALFFGVLVAVLGIVVSHFLSAEVYRGKMAMDVKKEQLLQEVDKIAAMPVWGKISDKVSQVFHFRGTGKGEGTADAAKLGGLNSGHFSRAGKVTFDNVTALVVTMPEMNRAVYLKGYTGARYTKTGWEELPAKAQREYEEIAQQCGITAQEQGYRMAELFYNGKISVTDLYAWGEAPVIRRGNMKVEYVTASKHYVYAPYYINPLERGEHRYEEDGYLSSKNGEELYDFSFYMPSGEFLNLFADYAEKQESRVNAATFYQWAEEDAADALRAFEEQYREFVYQYYTEVPEGHEELAGLLPGAANASVDGKIKAVQRYLSRYEYTLSPGVMPTDADFVNYFLFENKKGYCVHFASSAVLMLRSLGVPARYAEGYMITAQEIARANTSGAESVDELYAPYRLPIDDLDQANTRVVLQKRIEVRDYTAHAWVEVYRDGVGWVLVEVTGGYTQDTGEGTRPQEHQDAVAALPTPTPLPTRAVTPTPLPTNPPATPSPKEQNPSGAPKATNTPAPSSGAAPGASVTPGGQKPSQGQEEESAKTMAQRIRELPRWMWGIFFGVLAAALLFLLFFLRYRVVWRVRTNGKKTRKNQVLWFYGQMERILLQQGISAYPQEDYEAFARRVAGMELAAAKDFVRCQRTALMAGFGRDKITEEDSRMLEESYQGMRAEMFGKVSRMRRCYLKFVKLY